MIHEKEEPLSAPGWESPDLRGEALLFIAQFNLAMKNRASGGSQTCAGSVFDQEYRL